jgi:hypothetical protein
LRGAAAKTKNVWRLRERKVARRNCEIGKCSKGQKTWEKKVHGSSAYKQNKRTEHRIAITMKIASVID